MTMCLFLPFSAGALYRQACVLPTLNAGARPRPESRTWKSEWTESAAGVLDAGAAGSWCWSSLAVQEWLLVNNGQGEEQEVRGA